MPIFNVILRASDYNGQIATNMLEGILGQEVERKAEKLWRVEREQD